MNALKKLFGGNTRQFGMIFALVALIIFFQIATDGRTLTPGNVINLFNGNSYILILAIGMVLVIIAGHIDLSVGSVAAFVGVCVALSIRDWGMPWYLGILLGLGLGVADRRLAGLLDGLRRHPGVHRHALRHADLPRRQPVRRQVQHHPGSRGLPEDRLRLPARGRARTPATTTSPCCWACSPSRSWSSARSAPAATPRPSAPRSPKPGSASLKMVLICGAILYATLPLRHRPAGHVLPDPGPDPGSRS